MANIQMQIYAGKHFSKEVIGVGWGREVVYADPIERYHKKEKEVAAVNFVLEKMSKILSVGRWGGREKVSEEVEKTQQG